MAWKNITQRSFADALVKNHTQDKEATYNVKNGSDGMRKTTYSFKAHIKVEEGSICRHCLSEQAINRKAKKSDVTSP